MKIMILHDKIVREREMRLNEEVVKIQYVIYVGCANLPPHFTIF